LAALTTPSPYLVLDVDDRADHRAELSNV